MTKLRPSGGYRDTAIFRTATIIYDATYWFCEKFLDPRSRTGADQALIEGKAPQALPVEGATRALVIAQMVQAARSGRQNIAEGSRAAATSSQTELRLLNVARSSLEGLLLDFEDYLRHRRLPQWAPDSPEALAVGRVAGFFKKDRTNRADQKRITNDPSDPTDQSDQTDQRLLKDHWAFYAQWLEHNDPAVRANALICLINQANYLLDQQISTLEKQSVEEGGYSEQLATAGLAERSRKKKTDRTDPPDQSDRTDQRHTTEDQTDRTDQIPSCPLCGSHMVLRTAKTGRTVGKRFWGCSAYPECRGVVKL